MFSFEFNNKIIVGMDVIDITIPIAHEKVVEDRAITYYNYLNSIENYLVIPSIILCMKTNVIIDGHHRAWALKKIGKTTIPVTYIDYDNPDIIPHIDSDITKDDIIQSAFTGKLLEPKSSFHHIKGFDGQQYPIIMISSLFKI